MTKLSFSLNPAGGIIETLGLVYEPIGSAEYVYNWQGDKGIALAKAQFAETESKKGIKKKQYVGSYLEINGREFFFSGRPLQIIPWKLPSKMFFENYANGKIQTPTGEQIFSLVKNYFQTFLDFPLSWAYDACTIANLQSWIKYRLNRLVFLGFEGAWAGGKTTALEAGIDIQRHGFLAGNVSVAAIPRLIQDYDVSLGFNEVEVKANKKDDETWVAIRQANRRGTFYVRMNPRSRGSLETFSQFVMVSYDSHGEIEGAVRTRSIIVSCQASTDKRIPAINANRDIYALRVLEQLYCWYLDNIVGVVASVSTVASVAAISSDSENNREALWKEITKAFSKEETAFIQFFQGRNNELAFTSVLIARAFGLGASFLEGVQESLELKAELEAEQSFGRYEEFCRKVLLEAYKTAENKDATGTKFVVQKDVYESLLSVLAGAGLSEVGMTKFSGYLKDFGFLDGLNKKKARVGETVARCLFFDNSALQKLLATGNSGNDGNKKQNCSVCGVSTVCALVSGKPFCSDCLARQEGREQ